MHYRHRGAQSVREHRVVTIAIFGNFGLGNLGNNATLQAVLGGLSRIAPAVRLKCICTGPEVVERTHGIKAAPIGGTVIRPWPQHNPVVRLGRKLLVGIPSELWRWIRAFRELRDTDALVVPGTGLLTDASGITHDSGPYSIWKWSLLAKLRGCKVLFVSVGGGPLYSRSGRLFVRMALALADYRSYRDEATKIYLTTRRCGQRADPIYPDLAFDLGATVNHDVSCSQPPTIGIGLMDYAGRYSSERPSATIQMKYIEALAALVVWLTNNGYYLRLLVGDSCDTAAVAELKRVLETRVSDGYKRYIIDQAAESVSELFAQIEATDIVIATRFHNVLSAVLRNKPVIGVSFHPKCAALLDQMGLSEYCEDINSVDAKQLIAKFLQLRENAQDVKRLLMERVEACRRELDHQYQTIADVIRSDNRRVAALATMKAPPSKSAPVE